MREIERGGRLFRTGIWKLPAAGPVAVRGVNLEGDDQGDRGVHGGPHKAVYAYAREDIDWWQGELGRELADGVFGENLTLRGIDPGAALVGERWRIGSALLEVSEPRFPCWKLGSRFDDPLMVKLFARARRTGTYLRIVEEGTLAAGDGVAVIQRPDSDLTIAEFARIFLVDRAELSRLLIEQVSPEWRDWVRERVA